MKTTLCRTVACILLAFFTSFTLVKAGQEGKQPRMMNAVHLLQDAKKSDKPLPLLRSAKHALSKAAHNKEGNRVEAMAIIDKAITAAKEGNTAGMVNKIDSAIATIHNGMSKA